MDSITRRDVNPVNTRYRNQNTTPQVMLTGVNLSLGVMMSLLLTLTAEIKTRAVNKCRENADKKNTI